MFNILLALLRLFLPSLREWFKTLLKDKNGNDKETKELHQLSLLFAILVTLILVTVERGLSMHVYYRDKLHEAAYVRREADMVAARSKDLEEDNRFLRDRLTRSLSTLEYISEHEPDVLSDAMEATSKMISRKRTPVPAPPVSDEE